jgi:hypothetical protein
MAGLQGENGITIWRDPARALPQTDPLDRQLTIGMGCFLELLAIAASQDGLRAEAVLFPEGETGPLAHVTLTPGAAPDPLFAHVAARRTNRLGYDTRLPDAAALADLAPLARIVTDPEEVAAIRDLSLDAWQVEATTAHVHAESVAVMRFGKSQINANPDGIALGGAMLESLMAVGLMTRAGMADQNSSIFRQSDTMIRAAMSATPAYAVQLSAGNTRADQIAAGRRWLRLQLTATAHGLSLQPVSQALQEYPEMAALYAQVHEMLAKPGETVQMLARLGYGPDIDPAPRWPLESKLQHG